MILFAIFFPLVSLIVAFIVIIERNDENVPVLKYFLVAEVVFEATGQFIFNVYVRAHLVPMNSYVQFASIVLSYIAIIHGLGDKYAGMSASRVGRSLMPAWAARAGKV